MYEPAPIVLHLQSEPPLWFKRALVFAPQLRHSQPPHFSHRLGRCPRAPHARTHLLIFACEPDALDGMPPLRRSVPSQELDTRSVARASASSGDTGTIRLYLCVLYCTDWRHNCSASSG